MASGQVGLTAPRPTPGPPLRGAGAPGGATFAHAPGAMGVLPPREESVGTVPFLIPSALTRWARTEHPASSPLTQRQVWLLTVLEHPADAYCLEMVFSRAFHQVVPSGMYEDICVLVQLGLVTTRLLPNGRAMWCRHTPRLLRSWPATRYHLPRLPPPEPPDPLPRLPVATRAFGHLFHRILSHMSPQVPHRCSPGYLRSQFRDFPYILPRIQEFLGEHEGSTAREVAWTHRWDYETAEKHLLAMAKLRLVRRIGPLPGRHFDLRYVWVKANWQTGRFTSPPPNERFVSQFYEEEERFYSWHDTNPVPHGWVRDLTADGDVEPNPGPDDLINNLAMTVPTPEGILALGIDWVGALVPLCITAIHHLFPVLSIPCLVAACGYVAYKVARRCLEDDVAPATTFHGNAPQRYCTHCTPRLATILTVGATAALYSRALIPTACSACSYAPWLYPSHRAEIQIDSRMGRVLTTYSGLQAAKDRDTHGPLTNVVDSDPAYGYEHMVFNSIAGQLHQAQNTTTWFYQPWTNAYLRASQWQPLEGRGDPAGVPPPATDRYLCMMRELWDWVAHHGRQFPLTVATALDTAGFSHLFTARGSTNVPVPTTEFILATSHATPLSHQTAGTASSVAAAAPSELHPRAPPCAIAVGPVGQPSIVMAHKDATTLLAAAQTRMIPGVNPATGQPFKFDGSSAAAMSLRKFWTSLRQNVFTPEAILQAYHDVYGDMSLRDIQVSKYGPADVQRMVSKIEEIQCPKQYGKRSINGKCEVTEKPGKDARYVISHGDMTALTIVAAHVYEHLLMGRGNAGISAEKGDEDPSAAKRTPAALEPRPDAGVFRTLSIKGRDREVALDDFCRECSKPFYHQRERLPTCGFEIDQTGMELHERDPGTMTFPLEIFKRILVVIGTKACGVLSGAYLDRMAHDGKQFVMDMRVKSAAGDQQMFRFTFNDVYLDSGSTFTSIVNFSNESSATTVCLVTDGEKLLRKAQRVPGRPNTYALNNEDPNKRPWLFTAWGFYRTPDDTSVTDFPAPYRPRFEGDDGAGLFHRCLTDPRNCAIFKARMADLGFNAKLVTTLDGRLEFIGAHFKCTGGLIDATIPWCPSVARAMGKAGVRASRDATDHASTVARFLSLGAMFSGRVECMSTVFQESAKRYLRQLAPAERRAATAAHVASVEQEYKWEPLAVGTTLGKIWEQYNARHHARPFPPPHVQRVMVSNSLYGDPDRVTGEDMAKLMIWADAHADDKIDDEAVCMLRPPFLRDSLPPTMNPNSIAR